MATELDNFEKELKRATERDNTTPVVLEPEKYPLGVADEAVSAFIAGKDELDITAVTRSAAERLNLGLLYENIKIILNLQRQKQKVSILESMIYNPEGLNPDKGLIALYSYENNFYMQQMEYVRKYILNNKSALDDLNAETTELTKAFSQLSKDQIKKLKDFLKDLRSESSVQEDDILADPEI